ncbi:MAG TPA: FAD-dependent oxidoreductase [Burkholderiaceae bacterium]|nr:FAD-dependent oxidoreductase [Burkholderiaceae bacterium]
MSGGTIGIAGAGLLGRLLAWRLGRAGYRVSVFDPAPGPAARFGVHGEGQHAAGFTAAGMLSPLAELETAGPRVAELGWRSIDLWREIAQALGIEHGFVQHGSLMLAHRNDLGAAQRVLARLSQSTHPRASAQALDPSRLLALEPALQGAAHAWLLPDEAHVDPVAIMTALQAQAPNTQWHWNHRVVTVEPGCMALENGDSPQFDLVFDVRGTGARPSLPVRGVRGEIAWLHLAAHGLTRPVRLLHPRHRVYLVPRDENTVVVGASEIESEDRSPASVRSVVELLSAAYSVMPALAEARVTRLDTNLRPALPDNEPLLDATPRCVRINGLFRHGWLLAPALVSDALSACGALDSLCEVSA